MSIKKPGIKIMKESSGKNLKSDFRTVFIRCDCDSEILVMRYDTELDMMDICIFENELSFKNKMTWFQKFKYIYQVIINGHPYTDQIILSRKNIEEMKNFLTTL